MKDAEKQIEENLRAAGVSEYEKIDLQAYEKQADKLVKQLKKYQKDYEYVTFESNIHGFAKNGCGKNPEILRNRDLIKFLEILLALILDEC